MLSIRKMVLRLDELRLSLDKLNSEYTLLKWKIENRGPASYLTPHYDLVVYDSTSRCLSKDKLLRFLPEKVIEKCYAETPYRAMSMTLRKDVAAK